MTQVPIIPSNSNLQTEGGTLKVEHQRWNTKVGTPKWNTKGGIPKVENTKGGKLHSEITAHNVHQFKSFFPPSLKYLFFFHVLVSLKTIITITTECDHVDEMIYVQNISSNIEVLFDF